MQTPIPLYTIPNNEGTKTVFGVKITGAIYITDMKNPYSHVIVCVCARFILLCMGEMLLIVYFFDISLDKIEGEQNEAEQQFCTHTNIVFICLFSAFHSANNEKHFCSRIVKQQQNKRYLRHISTHWMPFFFYSFRLLCYVYPIRKSFIQAECMLFFALFQCMDIFLFFSFDYRMPK